MTYEEIDYFRRRESQERAAAKCASTWVARRAHQEMAEHYSCMLHDITRLDCVRSLRVCGAL